MVKDIGEEVRDELKDELRHLRSYYDDRIVDTIVFDPVNKVVGSEEWAVAAIDNGMDWHWSKFPNIDSLEHWVRTRKDNGAYRNASKSEVKKIAYKVGRKIMKDGIDPTFFVDSILGIYHRQVSIDI